MLRRLPKLALVLTLAGSLGLHWALLQSVAWVGMVVNFSERATLSQALDRTFDGKHLCPLCRAIAKARQTEKNPPAPLQLNKFEFLAANEHFIFCAPTAFWRIPLIEDSLTPALRAPPTPPPRPPFA